MGAIFEKKEFMLGHFLKILEQHMGPKLQTIKK